MRWRIPLVAVLALFVAVSCDQKPPTAPDDTAVDAADPAFKSTSSQANIGVNILLSTEITDAISSELQEFGRLRGLLPEINAVFLQTKSGNLPAIRALPYVAAASPDAERKSGPLDPIAASDFSAGWGSWNLDAVNVILDPDTPGHLTGYDGDGVYVAILDTGLLDTWRQYFPQERIATEHARSFGGGGRAGINVSTQPNKWEHSTNPHGTHVTSTVIGYQLGLDEVTGVAPMAKVIPVKILNQNGRGWSSVITHGVIYVADLKDSGALGGSPVVINMSLGGGNPDVVEQAAIDYAISKGVIIVAAAGNAGDWGMHYPGAYEPVISVAASGFVQQWTPCYGLGPRDWWWACDVDEPTDPLDFFIPDWSSRQKSGQDLDVVAPGVWVVGPWQVQMGHISYFFAYGTSMASPHVAGIVALMAEKDGTLTASQAESILESSAIPMAAGSRTVTEIGGNTVTYTWLADATGHGLATADLALAATP